MASVIQKLSNENLLNSPPTFLKNGMQLEVIMGSVAYGVSNDTSDMDVYGFCVPSRDYVFPHLRGDIEGFGKQGPKFSQFQQHHIKSDNKEYDLCIYSIVRFFQLCMENNPNMVDALFAPRRCVLYSTAMGEMVRDNRQLFLSKACWPKFRGYSYSQLHKMKTKKPEGKRVATIEKYGWDVKFGYHVVRLLDECEQILTTGDLDVTRDRERLKAIRAGEWTLERVTEFFEQKEKELEIAHQNCKLPFSADESAIKELLLNCLEHHYGSLDAVIQREDAHINALRKIHEITGKLL